MLIIKNLFVIHPSLLPKYRGASPIHYALLNGDTVTGVSAAAVSPKKFDAGTVFLQESSPVDQTDTYGSLVKKLGAVGGEMSLKLISNNYPKSGLFVQDESKVTKAPKFDAAANLLFFQQGTNKSGAGSLPSRQILNMCRMFRGSSHGYLKFSLKGKKVGFEDVCLLEDTELSGVSVGRISNPAHLDLVNKFARVLPPGSLHLFKNIPELKGFIALRLSDGFLMAKKIIYEGSSKTVTVGEFVKDAEIFGPSYQEFISLVTSENNALSEELVSKHVVRLD